jgi:hypothetical protein
MTGITVELGTEWVLGSWRNIAIALITDKIAVVPGTGCEARQFQSAAASVTRACHIPEANDSISAAVCSGIS